MRIMLFLREQNLSAEVETGVLNAYGTTFLRWLQLECLLYKLQQNAVFSSPSRYA